MSKRVPQGSILGPVPFSLYLPDLHKAIHYSLIHSNANNAHMLLSYQSDDSYVTNDTCSWFNKRGWNITLLRTALITLKSKHSSFNGDVIRIYNGGTELIHKSSNILWPVFNCS